MGWKKEFGFDGDPLLNLAHVGGTETEEGICTPKQDATRRTRVRALRK